MGLNELKSENLDVSKIISKSLATLIGDLIRILVIDSDSTAYLHISKIQIIEFARLIDLRFKLYSKRI